MLLRKSLAVLLLVVASLTVVSTAFAGYPPYLVLQTPPSGLHHTTRGYNLGTAHGVSTPAYSYGHFGVQPRAHASRHAGFYRTYKELSYK